MGPLRLLPTPSWSPPCQGGDTEGVFETSPLAKVSTLMLTTTDFTQKAEKFLDTTDHALNAGDYDSCVSRCYYAMFFMAEAVLLTKGLRASSHKGVISLFGEHFAKTGIFERD